MRDLKTHDIALASKWILKAISGNEPWKIFIRNNIVGSIIKK